MFESILVLCLEILADLTSFTSNSNEGFVRVFSVAAAPQKWSCLMQLKSYHHVQKSRPTSLSVRENVMLQSILQSANHVYKVKSCTDKSDPKHCSVSVVFVCSKSSGWDAGSRSNPVPFFMSSKGYGSFRNTFKPGVYKFSQPVPWFVVDEFLNHHETSKHPCIEVDFLGLVRSIHRKHRDVRKTCFGGACRIANKADTCLSSTKHLPFVPMLDFVRSRFRMMSSDWMPSISWVPWRKSYRAIPLFPADLFYCLPGGILEAVQYVNRCINE